MMKKQKTYVFYKQEGESVQVELPFGQFLGTNETFTSVVLDTPSPSTSPVLLASLVTPANQPTAIIQLSDGVDGVSYGVRATVTTNLQVFIVQIAVLVQQATLSPYQTMNPDAYRSLVDQIEAGSGAIGTAVFQYPATVDPSGGFVTWKLLDVDGMVYASGNAFDYNVRSNGVSNTVIARAIINVPSDIPPTLEGQKYQLQYEITLNPLSDEPLTNLYSEGIQVVGLNTTPLGTQDSVELKGDPAALTLVTDKLYESVMIELYYDNEIIGGAGQPVTQYERVPNGFLWGSVLDTSLLPVMLEPYTATWVYTNNGAQVYRESAALYVVNASIMQAAQDVLGRIQKAHATLYGTPDLLFPLSTVMLWLRRGRDYFNGAGGVPTAITMTNAKNATREFWLECSEMMALESQELAEAEKVFDFQGANISLSVDRTQAYGASADRIKARLDQDLKPWKVNLTIKGNESGDGSEDPSKLRHGAIGAVGVTITPASMWSMFPYGFPTVR